MSYIQFQQKCLKCKEEWNAAFGMAGTTIFAEAPTKCPYCGSTKLKQIGDGWKDDVGEFLRESNAIEGVYDEDSFKQAEVAYRWLMTNDKMTPHVVLKTHKLLMLNQPLMPDEKGYFRRVPVYIGGGEAMTPFIIPERIDDWCKEMNTAEFEGDLEDTSKRLHVMYEKIHPFVDGNGRTGRMFMNWWRIKVGGVPVLVIKEKEKHEYYKWFYETP